MQAIHERVGERMGLEALKKEQGLDVPSLEKYAHLSRLRELAILAMEAVEGGEVEFSSMSEVQAALKSYEDYRRLVEGKPSTQGGETTNINISLGGTRDPIKAVQALIAIAASTQDSAEDKDIIDVTPEED